MTISLFLCTLEAFARDDHHLASCISFLALSFLLSISLHKDRVQISIRMYSGKPRTTSQFKEAIREEMGAISRFVCKDVMDNTGRQGRHVCKESRTSFMLRLVLH